MQFRSSRFHCLWLLLLMIRSESVARSAQNYSGDHIILHFIGGQSIEMNENPCRDLSTLHIEMVSNIIAIAATAAAATTTKWLDFHFCDVRTVLPFALESHKYSSIYSAISDTDVLVHGMHFVVIANAIDRTDIRVNCLVCGRCVSYRSTLDYGDTYHFQAI